MKRMGEFKHDCFPKEDVSTNYAFHQTCGSSKKPLKCYNQWKKICKRSLYILITASPVQTITVNMAQACMHKLRHYELPQISLAWCMHVTTDVILEYRKRLTRTATLVAPSGNLMCWTWTGWKCFRALQNEKKRWGAGPKQWCDLEELQPSFEWKLLLVELRTIISNNIPRLTPTSANLCTYNTHCLLHHKAFLGHH